jgi:hypothetical protein
MEVLYAQHCGRKHRAKCYSKTLRSWCDCSNPTSDLKIVLVAQLTKDTVVRGCGRQWQSSVRRHDRQFQLSPVRGSSVESITSRNPRSLLSQ